MTPAKGPDERQGAWWLLETTVFPMERRTFLRAAGTICAASAIGVGAFTMGGAAASASISTNDTSLTNDDGEVQQVLIDPQLEVNWSDLDDAVGAVSLFIEARRDDMDDFYPVARGEMPLYPNMAGRVDSTPPGTTGHYHMEDTVSAIGGNLRRTAAGATWATAEQNGGLIIADAEHGRPDYDGASQTLNGNSISGVSEGYMQGANVYDGTIPDLDSIVNAEYGAVSGTVPFEETDDGASKTTTVELRYTIQLVQPGLQHFIAITGFDPVAYTENGTIGEVRDLLEQMYDESSETWSHPGPESTLNNADFLSDVMPEDITVVSVVPSSGDFTTADGASITWTTNQKRPVMMGDDGEFALPEGGPIADTPTTRHAAAARNYLSNNPNYPGFIAQDPAFAVTVNNEEAEPAPNDQQAGGQSNGDVK